MPQFAEAISGAEEAPAFLDRWPVWLTVSVALILGFLHGVRRGDAIRHMLAATGFAYGADKIGIVAATGCNSVYGSTYPYNPFSVPWTNSLFENAPADAMGIRLRWDQEEHTDRKLSVIGGDGAMYDIGFQSLSRMLMSGMDIKVLVLDTQVYSNTGGPDPKVWRKRWGLAWRT